MNHQDLIHKELASKYELNKYICEDITKSMFEFIADVMEERSYRPVRIPYLGIFAVKPNRLKKLKENKLNFVIENNKSKWD